jgi:hypothetical protein
MRRARTFFRIAATHGYQGRWSPGTKGDTAMNRFKTFALAAVAAAAISLAAAPQAEARPRHLGLGIGALAAGLIVGGAIAASQSRAYASECYLTRRWVDGSLRPGAPHHPRLRVIATTA